MTGGTASYRTHRPEFGGATPRAWWRCACGANGYTTSRIRARQAWREHVRDTDRDSGISLADKGRMDAEARQGEHPAGP